MCSDENSKYVLHICTPQHKNCTAHVLLSIVENFPQKIKIKSMKSDRWSTPLFTLRQNPQTKNFETQKKKKQIVNCFVVCPESAISMGKKRYCRSRGYLLYSSIDAKLSLECFFFSFSFYFRCSYWNVICLTENKLWSKYSEFTQNRCGRKLLQWVTEISIALNLLSPHVINVAEFV